MIDSSMTGTFQFEPPRDLLAHAKHSQAAKGNELHIEGWRGSWLSRLMEKIVGED